MEIASMNNDEKPSNFFTNGLLWFKSLYEELFAKAVGIAKQFKKIGKDDPRRVIHSLKVGLSLTLVSLFYYFQPLYNGFGVSTMWAIMTVVVVFEFSVGATLGKGLNRGMATLLAGVLGVGAHYLASATGKVVEPILLGLFVFLQGFGDEIFKSSEDIIESKVAKTSLIEYKSVLNSKNTEETLANFARWEPGHGQFKYRHPWKQYLKIGGLIRQCACRIDALNGYINSEIKAPEEIKEMIKETSMKMSIECGKALKELSKAVRKMNLPILADEHITNAKKSAKNLNSLLKSEINNWEEINLLQVIPVAAIASILTDIVICVEEIGQGVNELASLAHFKSTKSTKEIINTNKVVVEKIELSNNHVVITINEQNMKL